MVYKVVQSNQNFHKKFASKRDNHNIDFSGFCRYYALNKHFLVCTGSLKMCSTSTLKRANKAGCLWRQNKILELQVFFGSLVRRIIHSSLFKVSLMNSKNPLETNPFIIRSIFFHWHLTTRGSAMVKRLHLCHI